MDELYAWLERRSGREAHISWEEKMLQVSARWRINLYVQGDYAAYGLSEDRDAAAEEALEDLKRKYL